MKICEYENVRCPYCGEEKKLTNVGAHPFTHRENREGELELHNGPGHFVRCQSCGGEFIITCED